MESAIHRSTFSKKKMVSLEQRGSLMQRLEEDHELREVHAFLFEKPAKFESDSGAVHLRILRSLAKSDEQAFRREISELEARRISPDSDWCQNDCLVFVL